MWENVFFVWLITVKVKVALIIAYECWLNLKIARVEENNKQTDREWLFKPVFNCYWMQIELLWKKKPGRVNLFYKK